MSNSNTKQPKIKPTELVPGAFEHAIRLKVAHEEMQELLTLDAIGASFGVSPQAVDYQVQKLKKAAAQPKGGGSRER
jgi:hypothetical protein